MIQVFNQETSVVRDEIQNYLEVKNFYDSNNIADKDPNEVEAEPVEGS